MKALPFNIPKPENHALVFQEDHEYTFYDKLHQHEEIQISLIVKGEGTLVIGDTVCDYQPNDIFVIGANLPHVFRSESGLQERSLMLSLFFSSTSFGDHFFDIDEFADLKPVIKRSGYGIKVLSKRAPIKALFLQLKNTTRLDRFVKLIKILNLISVSNTKQLSSFVFHKPISDRHGNRMSAIFEYTMNHFKESIDLATISSVANMTTNAFCKYFKQRTNKTYIQFLNDIRIENACKLLLKNNDMSIEEIATVSGYSSIANFNRKFKKIKNMTPSAFRKLSVNH